MRDIATDPDLDDTQRLNTHPRIGTAGELLKVLQEEGIIGMWKDRDDIGDSVEFARKLRERATRRRSDE
jgi:hypothetical protein